MESPPLTTPFSGIRKRKKNDNDAVEEKDELEREIFRLTEELIKQSKNSLDQLSKITKITQDNVRLQDNLDQVNYNYFEIILLGN